MKGTTKRHRRYWNLYNEARRKGYTPGQLAGMSVLGLERLLAS